MESKEQSMIWVLGCDLIGLVVRMIDKCYGEAIILISTINFRNVIEEI